MNTASEKKVLIVEDDEAVLKALNAKLTQAGLAVLLARDGSSGLATALQEHPQLILLDILMPLMDGWEMLKRLREDENWGKQVSVVILTSLSADEDAQIRHIAELGPTLFMTKTDWKVEGVVDKVLEMLDVEKPPAPAV